MIQWKVLGDYLYHLDQSKILILKNIDDKELIDSMTIKQALKNDFIKNHLSWEVWAINNQEKEVIITLYDKSLKEVLLSLKPDMQVYIMDTNKNQTNHPITSKKALTDEFCFWRLEWKVIQLDKNEKITTIIVQYENQNLW